MIADNDDKEKYGAKQNAIVWGIHDRPSDLIDVIEDAGFTDESAWNLGIDVKSMREIPAGALASMVTSVHPLACTYCDEYGSPEYCEGAKWQLDDGLEGFYTACDKQLQEQINDSTENMNKEIEEAKTGGKVYGNPLENVEWIGRIEPLNHNKLERIIAYWRIRLR